MLAAAGVLGVSVRMWRPNGPTINCDRETLFDHHGDTWKVLGLIPLRVLIGSLINW